MSAANSTVSKNTRRRPIRSIANWTAVEFLIALLLMIVAAPFVEDLSYGNMIEAVLLTIVLLSSVLAVSDRRSTMIAALVLALPAIAARWIHHYRPEAIHPVFYLGAGLSLMVFVIVHYMRYLLGARVVTFTVLCAAVSTYLMLGLLWMMAYVLLATIQPDAFGAGPRPGASGAMTGFNAFYFSYVTLSTVGYGDIVPVSKPARMLAVMEAVTGTLFVATLVARLVAMHTSSQNLERAADREAR